MLQLWKVWTYVERVQGRPGVLRVWKIRAHRQGLCEEFKERQWGNRKEKITQGVTEKD